MCKKNLLRTIAAILFILNFQVVQCKNFSMNENPVKKNN